MTAPFFAVLALLFFASGCAALIYEVVWLQMLQLVIGSSAVSVAALLATFMGGMCAGSLLLPRIVRARYPPLRVFAAIEVAIGLCGVLVLAAMSRVDTLYAAVAIPGFAGMLARAAICSICLLPPAMLMGASLPAIARMVEPGAIRRVGYLYAANIAGGACGSLVAGFYLLRVYDAAAASLFAAALNLTAGLAAVALPGGKFRPSSEENGSNRPGARAVYAAIALSGFAALGAEVVWTRLLSLSLGATVYTFSLILAAFLVGLGAGSGAGSYLSRRTNPVVVFACCQALLSAAIAWAAYLIAWRIPYWPLDPAAASQPWLKFRVDFLRCAAAVSPAACLWGASFPLALAASAGRGLDSAVVAARVYGANTAGAIAGAVAFSIVAIPAWGTRNSGRLLIASSVLAALSAVAARRRVHPAAAAVIALAAIGTAVPLVRNLPGIPWGVVAYGRQLAGKSDLGDLLYLGEGMDSSIAISELDGVRLFHTSGKVEASSEQQDMRIQRMLGHVPALLHPRPRSALVVGCGAGVTAGSFVLHPNIEKIVICEIERLIPPSAARYFSVENHRVVEDRRTRIVHDDARHYILTTPEKFDIITSDPIHPWVKGSATLYTKEYFEMCKRSLKPGGFVAQWVPLYESTPDAVRSELATFFEVFPNGTVWGNDTDFEEGYDVVLLGQASPLVVDVAGLQKRLDRPDHARVVQALKQAGLGSAMSLLSTYAGRSADLRAWLAGAPINRDRNLRLQYLAGMSPEVQGAAPIYKEILGYRRFPEDLFAAPEAVRLALKKSLRGGH